MTTDHPPFEHLSALADGDLAPDVTAAVERHLADCATCRGEFARVRAVIARAAALPRAIEPPASAWSAVRRALRGPVTARPIGASPLRQWGLRAAAAVLLVAGSSAATLLLLRGRPPAGVVATAKARTPTPAVPAAVQAVERSYADVVAELTETLRAQRGALSPETVATLERTLRVIDEAIGEARAALAADPGNTRLVDVLAANYEQKVELLRRASELPART